MNRPSHIWLAAIVLIGYTAIAPSQEGGKQPFRLVQTISLPNVKGRLDHMDVDVKRKRLFVAGLENGTLEVVDLQAGKWVRSIPGFEKPQGALYVAELGKLFVASGDDGMLRVFWGDTLDLLDPIQLDRGPNRVMYEPHSKLVYVGYGGKDAGKDYGEIGIIDAKNDKHIGDIKVVAHPSELLLDKSGTTLFVLVSAANRIQVVDTSKRQVVSTWQVSSQHPGDAAFDELTSRLFIGTRTPPEMIVMDSKSSKEVATCQLRTAWTASILPPRESGCTSLEEESCRRVSFMSINRQMLTTTRSWGRSRHGEALAPLSGHPHSIAITSPLRRMKEQMRRFWYTHPEIEG